MAKVSEKVASAPLVNGELTDLHSHTATTASSGSYSGDNSVNRAIPHGLGVRPKIVLIRGNVGAYFHRIYPEGIGFLHYVGAAIIGRIDVTYMDATNFYVGNAADYDKSANGLGAGYLWIAIP